MRISRRLTICAVLTIGLSCLFGCPSPPPGGNQAVPGTPAAGKTFRAALVVDTGGIDDKSFNAAANEGRKRAQTELGLTDQTFSLIQSKAKADYKTNLAAKEEIEALQLKLNTIETEKLDKIISMLQEIKNEMHK